MINGRFERADIIFDFAKQAALPSFPLGTTSDYFVQRQELYVKIFGIINEASGLQTTILSLEGMKHDSNAVASQIEHYFSVIEAEPGRALESNAQMDSCTGQNKSNRILGCFALRVLLCFHYSETL